MEDHYTTLGVPRDAPADAIRKAYLRLARERHPDRFPDPVAKAEAQRFFSRLTEAFSVLSSPRQRHAYDAQLEKPAPTTPEERGREAFAKAQALLARGALEQAVEELHAAIHFAPRVAEQHAALGRALAELPRSAREAAAAFEEATRLDPKNAAYPLELARLLAAQGLKVRARRCAEMACRLDPANDGAAALLRELSS
jgi:curved DNA-binding protein CbpA